MGGGAWWAAVHGVARSRIPLSDFTLTFHFLALEKEMATHSSVLAWRIPGTGEPGGLPSMGLHRVGHDWSDLVVVAWEIRVNMKQDTDFLQLLGCLPFQLLVRYLKEWKNGNRSHFCFCFWQFGTSETSNTECLCSDNDNQGRMK